MTIGFAWRGISLGVFLLAVAAIVHWDAPWQWVFVVMAGMSLVNAVVKGRRRFAPHPLLWGAGLAYAYLSPPPPDPRHFGGWTMFVALCGASLVLSFLISLVPSRPRRPAPPPRPGAGIVIDVPAERSGDDH